MVLMDALTIKQRAELMNSTISFAFVNGIQ